MEKSRLCAVVTGGAKGIGAAIVKRLMEDGCGKIALVDLNYEAASAAAKRIDPTGNTVQP